MTIKLLALLVLLFPGLTVKEDTFRERSLDENLYYMETLLIEGIDTDAQDIYGDTALHVVAKSFGETLAEIRSHSDVFGNSDLKQWIVIDETFKAMYLKAEILVSYGASRTIKNNAGRTALEEYVVSIENCPLVTLGEEKAHSEWAEKLLDLLEPTYSLDESNLSIYTESLDSSLEKRMKDI